MERTLQRLERAMGRTMWLGHRLMAREVARVGLTVPQFFVLRGLAHRERAKEACSVGDLAERLQQSYPTVTGILDRLEREGLVERRRDPENRRVVRVRLTDQGRALLEELLERRRQVARQLLTRAFRPEELEQFAAYLERYQAALEAWAGEGEGDDAEG